MVKQLNSVKIGIKIVYSSRKFFKKRLLIKFKMNFKKIWKYSIALDKNLNYLAGLIISAKTPSDSLIINDHHWTSGSAIDGI